MLVSKIMTLKLSKNGMTKVLKITGSYVNMFIWAGNLLKNIKNIISNTISKIENGFYYHLKQNTLRQKNLALFVKNLFQKNQNIVFPVFLKNETKQLFREWLSVEQKRVSWGKNGLMNKKNELLYKGAAFLNQIQKSINKNNQTLTKAKKHIGMEKEG